MTNVSPPWMRTEIATYPSPRTAPCLNRISSLAGLDIIKAPQVHYLLTQDNRGRRYESHDEPMAVQRANKRFYRVES